ncbi:unnamed protein product [Cuscuta europaea]|uniref:AP2/ERF domain-containing protein n=1 Tax=Cuscuta europaea TaxID=41803 RepID=A0A9P0ZX90_CUSEU|nr:unnamed protein product [Cuscuta europaea]
MNELEDMQRLSKEEFLALLRRHSSGFSRGVSKYRGVARHHQNGRWEARIGLVTGSKYLYLGTFGTEEEAAAAYDMAALELKGPNAITNFQIKAYEHKLKEIGERSSSSQTNPPPPPLNDHQDNSKIRIEGDNVQVERLFTEEEAHPEAESFLLEAADVDSLAAGKEWCCPWSLCLDEEPPMSLHHQVKPLHFEFLNDSSFEDEIDFVFGKRVRAAAADQFGNDDDDVLGSGSGTQQQ